MGRIVTVTEEDFLVKQDKDYGIINRTYQQIYNFFSRHSQDCFYSVSLESDIPEVIDHAAIKEFGLFGISFNEDMVKIRDKHFLLILKENDLDSLENLQAAVEREKEAIGCLVFRYAVIEKEYTSDDNGLVQQECDNELLREVLPHIIVFNKGFPEIVRTAHVKGRLAGRYTYKNFAVFFAGRSIKSNSLTANLKNLNAIFNDILSVKGEQVIYNCYSIKEKGINLADPVYRILLPTVAAYLAIEHKFRFELSGVLNDVYLFAASDLTRQFYNYLDEYFKLILNPVDCGFTIKDRMAYLYVLDKNEIHGKPEKFCPVVRYAGVGFDLDTFSFIDGNVINAECSLNSLEVLCMEEIFGINAVSVAKAREGILKLGKVLGRFAAVLRKAHYPVNGVLDVTNTMLCRAGGVVYMAYVTGVVGNYPYNVQPVNARFKPFKEYVDVNMLHDVKDLFLLEDGVSYEKIMQKRNWVTGRNNHYKLPRTAHGIIYNRLAAVTGLVTEDIVMADELGLWYYTPVQFRGGKETGVLPYLSLDVARACNFLTCFGGPHPCVCTSFNLDYKCWR